MGQRALRKLKLEEFPLQTFANITNGSPLIILKYLNYLLKQDCALILKYIPLIQMISRLLGVRHFRFSTIKNYFSEV